MNLSGKNRLQTGAWGRFVLGMFVIAWLNIAAQPCLMAMEMAPDAVPASEHAAHAGHADHMSDETNKTDCGHCPTNFINQEALCESGPATGCDVFPGYNVDGRQFEKPLKDFPQPQFLSAIEWSSDCTVPVTLIPPQDYRRLKFAGDPPLNIRHCIFLK